MAQWISTKGIADKYQISEEEIKELADRQFITCSRIGNALLIDEESFISYMELIKQIENKEAIIKQLNQSDQLLERELQACNETTAAFTIGKQMFPLYPLVIRTISMLVPQGEARQIFNALAMGERLDLVARQYGMGITETLLIYNKTIQTINQDGESVIGQWTKRCLHLEKLNARYINANIALSRKRKNAEKEVTEQYKNMIKFQELQIKQRNRKSAPLPDVSPKGRMAKQLERNLKVEKERYSLPHQSGIKEWITDSLHTTQGLIRRLFREKG